MNDTARILCAISSTEPCTFREFLDALGDDRPARWGDLFSTLEKQELVTIERVDHKHGRINAMQLTELGAERAREAQEANR